MGRCSLWGCAGSVGGGGDARGVAGCVSVTTSAGAENGSDSGGGASGGGAEAGAWTGSGSARVSMAAFWRGRLAGRWALRIGRRRDDWEGAPAVGVAGAAAGAVFSSRATVRGVRPPPCVTGRGGSSWSGLLCCGLLCFCALEVWNVWASLSSAARRRDDVSHGLDVSKSISSPGGTSRQSISGSRLSWCSRLHGCAASAAGASASGSLSC